MQNETSSDSYLQDLSDSFGGLPGNTENPVVTRLPERQIGVYYLVDWNTFLDIDDQKGTRVNLRIQPKIGNPNRFFSVSVP